MSEHDPTSSTEHYEVLSYDGQTTVLPEVEPSRPRSRAGRFAAIGVAAALVVGAGVGVVTVAAALGGGGAQPETMVPANAVFYAEVDLDPSAGQKVDAFRFLRKFPALKDAFTADGGYGPGFAKLFDGSDVDYATDVEPWLGKRFAVALVPGPKESAPPRVMVVLQTTDEAKAAAGLNNILTRSNNDGLTVAVSHGFAVLAAPLDWTAMVDPAAKPSTEDVAAELVAEAQTASLAHSGTYTDAIKPYGDTVATVWVDGAAMGKAMKSFAPALGVPGADRGLGSLSGQSVAVLRFDGDTLEVRGQSTGSTEGVGSGGVSSVATLPDSTLAALGGTQVGTLLQGAYASTWDQFGAATGEDVPAPKEWPTLFGDQTVVAVGPGSSQPEVGVHVVGGQDTVDAVLHVVQQTLRGSATVGQSADGVVVASSRQWLDAMTAGGSFGDSATFKDAVPDAADAGAVGFADIDGLVQQYGSGLSADDRANLDPLRAVGFSAGSHDGTTTFRLRLLTD